MKLLISSDWHADARTLGHARFMDVDLAVRETVEAAVREKVDAYLFLGDLCDPDSGGAVFRSVELAVSVALELANQGIQSVWVAGNHDVIEDGSGDTTLSPLRPLARVRKHVHLFERPGTVFLNGPYPDLADGVTVLALPYTATSHAYRPATAVSDQMTATGPRAKLVVVAHLAVVGVEPGEETTDMPRGRDVLFPREMFPDTLGTPTTCFNGHYHRQQRHELPGHLPVHIPGAPTRFTFGEAGNSPGYLIAEV